MLICIVLSILFWIFGIKFLKVQIYKNIPTKEKLDELLKKKKIIYQQEEPKKIKIIKLIKVEMKKNIKLLNSLESTIIKAKKIYLMKIKEIFLIKNITKKL